MKIFKQLSLSLLGVFGVLSYGILPASAATSANIGIQADVQATRQQIKDSRATLRQDIKDKKASTTIDIKAERDAMRAKLETEKKNLQASIKLEIKNFKAGVKVKLDNIKKENIKKILEKAFNKLSAAVARIGAFDKRVSDAIAERKSKGLNTTEAEAKLQVARTSLDQTKITVDAINAAVNESVASSTMAVGIAKEAVKASIQKAMDAVRDTKSKYEEVIKALPKIGLEANVTASTTQQ